MEKTIVRQILAQGGRCGSLCVPIAAEKFLLCRVRITVANLRGNGRLYFDIFADDDDDDKNHSLGSAHLDCPIDPPGWRTYDVDVATGRIPANIPFVFLRVTRTPGGTGTVLVDNMVLEKLPPSMGPSPEPRLLDYVESDGFETVAMEEFPVNELDQQTWRGRRFMAKKDGRGLKCQSMEGEKAFLFVPVEVEPDALYRIHLDLKCESGNGKLFCNFYANRSFDFPQVVLACEAASWSTFDVQLQTGSFPPNLPVVIRLWRTPGGTGSLLVRRIAFEKMSAGMAAEEPKIVASSAVERMALAQANTTAPIVEEPNTASTPGQARRIRHANRRQPVGPVLQSKVMLNKLAYSCFERQATKVFFVSETGDEASMRAAFEANGLQCDTLQLAGDAPRLPDLVRNRGGNWIHLHLGRNTTVTAAIIDQIRSVGSGITVTAWIKPGWPVFDTNLLSVLRCMDVALVRSDVELSTYRSAGCFNAELWDPGMAVPAPDEGNPEHDTVALVDNPQGERSATERVRELATRLGFFETVSQRVPKDRSSYGFKRVMCAMRLAPAALVAGSDDGDACFAATSFTECRDLAAKIIEFNPDLLHIHLDAEDDGLPWRDLLLDLRRRVPTMLVTAWHPGGQALDRRMMDLRFSVDHLLVGGTESVPLYHAASMVGTEVWNPGARPSENPAVFRDAMFAFARGMGERRARFLRAANGGKVDLTVFIGTYNRLSQLRQAVETALASAAHRTVEIVVNDAGSADGTQEWLRRMAEADARVVPIFSSRRTSFTQAFNESLQIAKGKYICWLSDDIVSEGIALSNMCLIMDELDPVDMGGFCVRNSWSHEYTVRKDSGIYFPTVGCMYTETLRKLNGINMDYPYYSQDTDLDMRVLRLGGRIVA